jgi:AraC family transcriptional regulator, L-rhamnose operon transcriptional activator RhaR
MEGKSGYEPFEIAFREVSDSIATRHGDNFFELVYILKGTGIQTINKHKLPYLPGHLFLITPDDTHALTVEEATTFFQIRFTQVYIKNSVLHAESIRKLEYILQHANHQPGCILKKQTDKSLLRPVIDAIIREYVNRDLYNKELIHLLVNTIIVIVARNIAEYLPEKANEQSETRTLDILAYIQSNIYYPAKLSTRAISDAFGISESYLGRYFKKHFNQTLQDYIVGYKLKLIVNRLLYSDLRIGEIAEELGFSDESHLNKIFKKYKGTSPTMFRKHNAATVSAK